MKRITILVLLAALLLSLGATALAQDAVELTFWYNDGHEGDVMRDLLDRFEEANPGIKVNIEVQPYSTVRDQLRVQVEAGQAPDIARLTDFAGMRGFYLDIRPYMEDPALFEDNFNPAIIGAFRSGPDDDGLYGFADQLSVTAPYVNATLFEHSGVDLPSMSWTNPAGKTGWRPWTRSPAQPAFSIQWRSTIRVIALLVLR